VAVPGWPAASPPFSGSRPNTRAFARTATIVANEEATRSSSVSSIATRNRWGTCANNFAGGRAVAPHPDVCLPLSQWLRESSLHLPTAGARISPAKPISADGQDWCLLRHAARSYDEPNATRPLSDGRFVDHSRSGLAGRPRGTRPGMSSSTSTPTSTRRTQHLGKNGNMSVVYYAIPAHHPGQPHGHVLWRYHPPNRRGRLRPSDRFRSSSYWSCGQYGLPPSIHEHRPTNRSDRLAVRPHGPPFFRPQMATSFTPDGIDLIPPSVAAALGPYPEHGVAPVMARVDESAARSGPGQCRSRSDMAARATGHPRSASIRRSASVAPSSRSLRSRARPNRSRRSAWRCRPGPEQRQDKSIGFVVERLGDRVLPRW